MHGGQRRTRPGGTPQFFTLNLTTGAATPLAFQEFERTPVPPRPDWQMLPKRDEMIFLKADATGWATFLARPIAGGATRTLATLETPLRHRDRFPGLTRRQPHRVRNEGDMARPGRRAAGRRPHLGNFTAPAAWSPDGRYLLYDAGQPQVFDATTGKSWPLI